MRDPAIGERVRRALPPLGAASALVVIFLAVLSIPLATAEDLGLTEEQTAGWIMALYGLPGLLTIVLAWRYRQPLVVTGNIFFLIFVASLGADLAWAELVGASILSGAIVLVLGPLGIVGRLAAWLPAPIVFGLLAGAVLHFFVELFTVTGDDPVVAGGTLVVYLLGRRFLDPRIPALLPALVTGVVLVAVTGELGSARLDLALTPSFTTPELSLGAVATVTPVMVVLITLQANVPSLVYLGQQDYAPPEASVSATSGLGTVAGSLLGPIGLSLSLPATALCAGPDAGEHGRRHWAAYIAGAAALAIGLGAGVATQIAEIVPRALLVALVGLAVVGVLATALQQITKGPLTLGPLFAFAISQSELEFADLGPFFWALVGGLAVSLLLEREGWRELGMAGGGS